MKPSTNERSSDFRVERQIRPTWARWAVALAAISGVLMGPTRGVAQDVIEIDVTGPAVADAPKLMARPDTPIGKLRFRDQTDALRSEAMTVRERADFVDKAQSLLSRALASYALKEPAPLQAQVFDIENPLLSRVLTKSTGRPSSTYDHLFLAMQYYPMVTINGKPSPLCFILFNGKKAGALSATFFPSREEWVGYLVMHEFGHCIVAHQEQLGRISRISPRQDEAFADMFAMGYALARGHEATARAVLKLQDSIRPVDDEGSADAHYEPVSRRAFLQRWLEAPPAPHDVFDLYRDTLAMFSAVKPD